MVEANSLKVFQVISVVEFLIKTKVITNELRPRINHISICC